MSQHEQGLKRLQEILGDKATPIINSLQAISPDFANYIINFAYGDLYARSGLSDKTRELAAVANLIGQGNTGLPLKAHLHGMLNVGWEQQELTELIIFLVGYSGFPTAVEAIKVLQEVIIERKSPK